MSDERGRFVSRPDRRGLRGPRGRGSPADQLLRGRGGPAHDPGAARRLPEHAGEPRLREGGGRHLRGPIVGGRRRHDRRVQRPGPVRGRVHRRPVPARRQHHGARPPGAHRALRRLDPGPRAAPLRRRGPQGAPDLHRRRRLAEHGVRKRDERRRHHRSGPAHRCRRLRDRVRGKRRPGQQAFSAPAHGRNGWSGALPGADRGSDQQLRADRGGHARPVPARLRPARGGAGRRVARDRGVGPGPPGSAGAELGTATTRSRARSEPSARKTRAHPRAVRCEPGWTGVQPRHPGE